MESEIAVEEGLRERDASPPTTSVAGSRSSGNVLRSPVQELRTYGEEGLQDWKTPWIQEVVVTPSCVSGWRGLPVVATGHSHHQV